MHTREFNYELPQGRIAQYPLPDRLSARLLFLPRITGKFQDLHVRDLSSLVRTGDLLVFNNSKVFRARLKAMRTGGASPFEVFLLRPEGTSWLALIRNSKRLSIGETITLPEQTPATLLAKEKDGVIRLQIDRSIEDVFALCERTGDVPTPPYIEEKTTDETQYQTVYAKEVGSVAAPTAGFHFTEALLAELVQKGIKIAYVTLHVGLGTFRPMQDGTLDEHIMHTEWVSVSEETVRIVEETKKQGGRVIAVGTTSTRSLESAAQSGALQPFEGMTNLFIRPGYTFHVIDGLITNFHLPKSTLLVLVSALAGRERVLEAYQHAILEKYRFYSFGDAMILL